MTLLVEGVAVNHIVIVVVAVAPRIEHCRVYYHCQQHIHRNTCKHHDKALPSGLCAELPGLRVLLHTLQLLLVDRLVNHTRNRDIATQGQPADAILRVANLALPEREPGVEEDVELLDTNAEDACSDKVSELVNKDK